MRNKYTFFYRKSHFKRGLKWLYFEDEFSNMKLEKQPLKIVWLGIKNIPIGYFNYLIC